MKISIKSYAYIIAVAGVLGAAPLHAADAYPSRPIRWIVPAPPGGGTDAVSRIMAPRLTEIFKQQIVVDNRGGVQGSIATALAAKSAPDGYTILFAFSGPLAVNPHIYSEVGYDATRDFAGLTRYTQQPMIMTAHPSLPVATLKELAGGVRTADTRGSCVVGRGGEAGGGEGGVVVRQLRWRWQFNKGVAGFPDHKPIPHISARKADARERTQYYEV